MSDQIDLSKYQVRTDLAIESHQMAKEEQGVEVPGVHYREEKFEDISMIRMTIENEEGSNYLHKPIGNYLTFEAPTLRNNNTQIQEQVTKILAIEFEKYLQELKIPDDARVLIIGLGNWNVTPDALGPMVVENLLITRHLFEIMPDKINDGIRSVSAVAPGVLGITGIETSEIVLGIVEKSKPDLVIAIDALASRSLERVYSTIQIADTGIHPGSGIGNKRKSLDRENLGVPVIAIGVPTVVDAVSITSDTIDYIIAHLQKQMDIRNPFASSSEQDEKSEKFLGLIGTLNDQEKRQLIKEVLSPMGHNLIVTPKEVDDFMENMANIIANGLNMALHKEINEENVSTVTH